MDRQILSILFEPIKPEFGDCLAPSNYKYQDKNLGVWVSRQRHSKKALSAIGSRLIVRRHKTDERLLWVEEGILGDVHKLRGSCTNRYKPLSQA